MSLETYEMVIKNLEGLDFSGRISYDFYNEPMLHPQFTEIVQLTKKILPKCKIHLYSNGTLLTQNKFNELIKSGIDKFVITQHEQDENKENYIFTNVYKSLNTNDREKVIFRSYKDLKLVNRAGILKQIATEGLALHPCFIPSHMVTVSVDARVISCFEDYNENLVFGDLKKEKLIDIWDKNSYKQFRGSLQKGLRHLFVTCKDCSRKEALPPFDI